MKCREVIVAHAVNRPLPLATNESASFARRREICRKESNCCRRTIRTAVGNFALLRLIIIVMDSSNTENEEIGVLDPETPRAAPRDTDIVPASENDSDLVRKLLTEVSKIRDENKQLRKEMENLKTKRKTKLSQKLRDYDSECSVSSYSLNF